MDYDHEVMDSLETRTKDEGSRFRCRKADHTDTISHAVDDNHEPQYTTSLSCLTRKRDGLRTEVIKGRHSTLRVSFSRQSGQRYIIRNLVSINRRLMAQELAQTTFAVQLRHALDTPGPPLSFVLTTWRGHSSHQAQSTLKPSSITPTPSKKER